MNLEKRSPRTEERFSVRHTLKMNKEFDIKVNDNCKA